MTTLSDLETDVRHLGNLLEVAAHLSSERDGRFDRDHIDSLLWIARDCAAKCQRAAHDLLFPGDGK